MRDHCTLAPCGHRGSGAPWWPSCSRRRPRPRRRRARWGTSGRWRGSGSRGGAKCPTPPPTCHRRGARGPPQNNAPRAAAARSAVSAGHAGMSAAMSATAASVTTATATFCERRRGQKKNDCKGYEKLSHSTLPCVLTEQRTPQPRGPCAASRSLDPRSHRTCADTTCAPFDDTSSDADETTIRPKSDPCWTSVQSIYAPFVR